MVGGVLTATATFLTVRWQTRKLLQDERDRSREARDDEHRDWLRRREEQALAALLVVLNEIQKGVPHLEAMHQRGLVAGGRRQENFEGKYAYEALLHGQRVDLPLVETAETRQIYLKLVALVEEFTKLPRVESREVRDRRRADLVRFVGHVRHVIKAGLHAKPPPTLSDPPVLTRNDAAPWTPQETDPEDTYFPDAEI